MTGAADLRYSRASCWGPTGTRRQCLRLLWLLLLLCLCDGYPLAQQQSGAKAQSAATDCTLICNSQDLSAYRPQDCSRLCRGYNDGLTDAHNEEVKRVASLERQVQKLETRLESLLIVVVLLSLVVLLLVPVLVYRTTLARYFFPLCCASHYAKKKKNGSGGGSGRRGRRGGNAPTNRPNTAPPTDGGADTVIANGAAVRMAAVMTDAASTQPPAPVSLLASPPRVRHPSESSCTAEASSCDPNSCCDDHAYYNFGCSSSTLAVSPTQSRVSATSQPLSAGALLTTHSTSKNTSSHSLTPEAEQRDDTARRSTMERRQVSRRPSSPESPNIVSNATIATTLSCGTLTSDI